MKKTLLSVAWLALVAAVAFWSVNAQVDISELFNEGTPLVDGAHAQLLNDYDSSRGYTDSTAVSCDANGNVTITSAIVEDSAMDPASVYNLFISPYRMDQIKSWDPSVDISKIIMKKVEVSDDSEVSFDISSSDVDENTPYYGFISPADMFDVVWTPSKEVCFLLSDNMCLQDSACDTLGASHNAANEEVEMHWTTDCVWMDLANVSHTVDGNVIHLKWTAVDGDDVEIAIFDPEAEIYKSLGTAKMSDEKFDYTLQWSGEQNFMLTNGCKDLYYKADAKVTEKEPEKIVPAATGPAENILYVAIAAIVLYGAYVVFFRKSESK